MRFPITGSSVVIVALFAAGPLLLRADQTPDSEAPNGPATAPQEAKAKQRDIHRLLELSGSGKLGVQIAGQMIEQFKKSVPNVPPEFWDEFKKEIKPDELNELVVPVYEKHFTDADIRELIKFYESPIGRKLISEMPQVMQESMSAGQQWGQQLARKVQQRLKAKGYLQT